MTRKITRKITRKPLRWLASIIRKSRGKLSMRRSSMIPKIKKTKVRGKISPSLSLQVKKGIGRTPIIRDKR
jgi:hypothetical protein